MENLNILGAASALPARRVWRELLALEHTTRRLLPPENLPAAASQDVVLEW